MLDRLLTKHKKDIKDIECYPLRKSDHVILIVTRKLIVSKERKGKYNYKRDDYRSFKGFYEAINHENLAIFKVAVCKRILNKKFQPLFVQDPYFKMINNHTKVKITENITFKKKEIKDIL